MVGRIGIAKTMQTRRGGVEVSEPITFALDGLTGDALAALVLALDPGRRLLTSHEDAICRMRRVDDDAEMDFSGDAEGTLDTAAVDTWLGASAGALVTTYDQVGSNDHTQSNKTLQAIYSASVEAINGRPGFLYPSQGGLYGAVPVTSRPFTICTTFCPTTTYGASDYLWAITGSNPGYNLFITATGPLFRARNGGAVGDAQGTTAPVNGTPGYVEAREVAANERYVRMNGTGEDSDTTSSTPGFTGTGSYGNLVGGGTSNMLGYMMTHLGFEADLADSQDARNLVGNAAEWYGVAYTDVLS